MWRAENQGLRNVKVQRISFSQDKVEHQSERDARIRCCHLRHPQSPIMQSNSFLGFLGFPGFILDALGTSPQHCCSTASAPSTSWGPRRRRCWSLLPQHRMAVGEVEGRMANVAKVREFLWRLTECHSRRGDLAQAEAQLRELLRMQLASHEQRLEALCFLADIQVPSAIT